MDTISTIVGPSSHFRGHLLAVLLPQITVAEMLVIQLIQNPNYLHRGVQFSVNLPVLQKFLQICLILHKNHKIIAKRGLLLTDYLQNPLFGDRNY